MASWCLLWIIHLMINICQVPKYLPLHYHSESPCSKKEILHILKMMALGGKKILMMLSIWILSYIVKGENHTIANQNRFR